MGRLDPGDLPLVGGGQDELGAEGQRGGDPADAKRQFHGRRLYTTPELEVNSGGDRHADKMV
jgi:hypothetical protein